MKKVELEAYKQFTYRSVWFSGHVMTTLTILMCQIWISVWEDAGKWHINTGVV